MHASLISRSVDGPGALPARLSLPCALAQATTPPSHCSALVDCLISVLSVENTIIFCQARGLEILCALLPNPGCRGAALRVQRRIIAGGSSEAPRALVALLEGMRPDGAGISATEVVALQLDVLAELQSLVVEVPAASSWFVRAQGFAHVLSVLVSLEQGTTAGAADKRLPLLLAVLATIAAVVRSCTRNRTGVETELRYDAVIDAVRLSGLLQGTDGSTVCAGLISLACADESPAGGSAERPPAVVAPEAIVAVLKLLGTDALPQSQKQTLVSSVRGLCSCEANAICIGHAGAPAQIIRLLHAAPPPPIALTLLGLLFAVSRLTIATGELRALLRLAGAPQPGAPRVPSPTLAALASMAEDPEGHLSAPFVELCMAGRGHASVLAPGFARCLGSNAMPTPPGDEAVGGGTSAGAGDRLPVRRWPPEHGLSLMMWARVVKWGTESQSVEHPMRLFAVVPLASTSRGAPVALLELAVSNDMLLIRTAGPTQRCPNTAGRFTPGQWVHVALVVTALTASSCQAAVYLDGTLVDELKIPSLAPPAAAAAGIDAVCARIGTSPADRRASELTWRAGPLLLIEGGVRAEVIKAHWLVGPRYTGTLQGPLAHLQPGWCSVLPPRSRAAHHWQSFEASNPELKALVPDGAPDLRQLPVPLVPRDALLLALMPSDAASVSLATVAATLAGGVASAPALEASVRALARHLELEPSQQLALSVSNRSGRHPRHAILGGSARACAPVSPAWSLEQVGGVGVALRLVADAGSAEGLQDSVALFVHCVRRCPENARDAEKHGAFAILGAMLARRSTHLSRGVFEALQWLVTPSGGVDRITHAVAFQELFLSHDVWRGTAPGLARLPYAFVGRLLAGDDQLAAHNCRVLAMLQAAQSFLATLRESSTPASVAAEIASALKFLFARRITASDTRQLGLFLLATLVADPSADAAAEEQRVNARILVLGVMLALLRDTGGQGPAAKLPELIDEVHGVTFFLKLLGPRTDGRSVSLVLQIMVELLRLSPSFSERFTAAHGFDLLAYLLRAHAAVHGMLLNLVCLLHHQPSVDAPRAHFDRGAVLAALGRDYSQIKPVAEPLALPVLLSVLGKLHSSCAAVAPTVLPAPGNPFSPPAKTAPSPGNPFAVPTPAAAPSPTAVPDAATAAAEPAAEAERLADVLAQHLEDLHKGQADFRKRCMRPGTIVMLAEALCAAPAPRCNEPPASCSRVAAILVHSAVEAVRRGGAPIVLRTMLAGSLPPDGPSPALLCRLVLQPVLDTLTADVVLSKPASAELIAAALSASTAWLAATDCGPSMLGPAADVLRAAFGVVVKAVGADGKLHRHVQGAPTLLAHLRSTHAAASRTLVRCLACADAGVPPAALFELLTLANEFSPMLLGSAFDLQWGVGGCLVRQLVQLGRTLSTCGGKVAPQLIDVLGQLWRELVAREPRLGASVGGRLPQGGDGLAALAGAHETLMHATDAVASTFEAASSEANAASRADMCEVLVAARGQQFFPGSGEGGARARRSGSLLGRRKEGSPGKMVATKGADGRPTAPGQVPRAPLPPRSRACRSRTDRPQFDHVRGLLRDIGTTVRRASEYEAERARRRQHRLAGIRQHIAARWCRMDAELHREGGVFGPNEPNRWTKYALDTREGPARMRLRLAPDSTFYDRFGPVVQQPGDGDGDGPASPRPKHPPPASHDTGSFRAAREVGNGWEWAWTHCPLELWPGGGSDPEATVPPASPRATETPPTSPGGNAANAADADDSEGVTLMQLLPPGDSPRWSEAASLPVGLNAVEGLFVLCTGSLCFAAGYAPGPDGTVVRRQQPAGASVDLRLLRWALEDIRDIRRRRYSLQDCALELFEGGGQNAMLAFPDRACRERAYAAVLSAAPALVSSAEESVDGMQRDAKLERSESLISGLLGGARTVKQRWEAGELTNFEYLMHLNTLVPPSLPAPRESRDLCALAGGPVVQ